MINRPIDTERKSPRELLDGNRIEDAAVNMCRSGEALFRYFSRLDHIHEAGLSREAFAERAQEAELHMRVLLSAALESLNELHDLRLLDGPLADDQIDFFNKTRLEDAVREAVEIFRQRLPSERWDWLAEASCLLDGVEMKIERDKDGSRGTLTHNGRTKKSIRLDPTQPSNRVSQRDFFSNGSDRIFVATSSVFLQPDGEPKSVAGYDAVIGGLAFAREWMFRHARYAEEAGPPARSGGGPALAVIAVVLAVAAGVAAVTAAVLGIVCAAEGGEGKACGLAAFFGTAATVLGYGERVVDGEAKKFQYGTNNQ